MVYTIYVIMIFKYEIVVWFNDFYDILMAAYTIVGVRFWLEFFRTCEGMEIK